jgi:hypothetical protein
MDSREKQKIFEFMKGIGKNNYLINNYARPRGLISCQKIPVLSESEQFFAERYSKKAFEDRDSQKRNIVLGRMTQISGFKGNKKPPKKFIKPRRLSLTTLKPMVISPLRIAFFPS